MQRQKTEVEVSALTLTFMIVLIIFLIFTATIFGLQNKRHKDTIEIYEEYYVLDEYLDVIHRQWVEYFQSYGEEEYYLRYYARVYLRYLELKEIIGETVK